MIKYFVRCKYEHKFGFFSNIPKYIKSKYFIIMRKIKYLIILFWNINKNEACPQKRFFLKFLVDFINKAPFELLSNSRN